MGDLFCLDITDGKVIWSKNFPREYSARVPMWGFCGHPLVYRDLVICIVGGEGSVVVAFDKETGEEKWKALNANVELLRGEGGIEEVYGRIERVLDR